MILSLSSYHLNRKGGTSSPSHLCINRFMYLSSLFTQAHLHLHTSSSELLPLSIIQYKRHSLKKKKKMASFQQTIQCPKINSDLLLTTFFLHFEHVCFLNLLITPHPFLNSVTRAKHHREPKWTGKNLGQGRKMLWKIQEWVSRGSVPSVLLKACPHSRDHVLGINGLLEIHRTDWSLCSGTLLLSHCLDEASLDPPKLQLSHPDSP